MRKVLADMHVPPAWRRWITRTALAVVIALVVAYVPWRMSGNGDRADRLHAQLDRIRRDRAELELENARLEREIHALRNDPQAIEDHARDELGMVYPGELVIRIEGDEGNSHAEPAGQQ